MPEEPSVLDYLKSKLKFWVRGEKIEIPALGRPPEEISPDAPEMEESETVVPEPAQASSAGTQPAKDVQPHPWPWRSLLALGLALLGQRTWEPSPDRTAGLGLLFYLLALAFLVWAALRREWTLAPILETGSGTDTLRVRRLPLFLGIPLALFAFISLGDNLFTLWNVSLWVLAIICFVWAFWLPQNHAVSVWSSMRAFFARDAWQIKITRWTLLVLVVAAVVTFFRVYNIPGVPSQPVSDHAEKILDVFDVSRGQTHIFFPRNTGREAIQMYLTLVVSWIFGTGLSFLSLKIGTVICGLATLPYLYLLGKELGNRRIGLLAVFFAGIAYWPNVISRVGLRFPLYPLFVAPTLYYLLRGLRSRSRNDFILSGLFLGVGLHGYTPFRIVPIVVVIAIGVYLLHAQSKGNRKQAVLWLLILATISFIVFLPLARYWLDNPGIFSFRAFSRLASTERPLPGPAIQIFFMNTWNALRMFNWNDGETWVHSIVYRPALGVVSGALFILGSALVLIRYIRQRHWQDLFLLLAIPLLELPSILSLAFPNENPVLTRTGAALIPVFLLVAMALDGMLTGILSRMNRRSGAVLAWCLVLVLGLFSSFQNYDLVFHQYADQYTASANDTSDMGAVIRQFKQVYGTSDSVWIVAFPYWVDTRLPGIWAGIPDRDFALWPQDFNITLDVPGPKLLMIKPDDIQDVDLLRQMYPQGVLSRFHSTTNLEDKDFLILFVPANE
jgi:4-amino-4-deoxy-L-arabinose transferase-like glycosyltransferase